MSLEESLDANTKALNRLADAMEKGGGAAASGSAASGGKTGAGKAGAGKPKNSVGDMKAAVMKVKDVVGEDEAKAIISQFAGKNKKLADLANLPDKFDAVVAACEEALAEGAGGGEAEDEDGGI